MYAHRRLSKCVYSIESWIEMLYTRFSAISGRHHTMREKERERERERERGGERERERERERESGRERL
jgi:hypothetical protein